MYNFACHLLAYMYCSSFGFNDHYNDGDELSQDEAKLQSNCFECKIKKSFSH